MIPTRARPEAETGVPRWRFHAQRWALLLIVALLTHLAFPSPAIVEIPTYGIGVPADRTVVAPVSFVVRKSEEEIAREGEDRALTVRPVYRFDAQARDSAVAALGRFIALIDVAAPSGPALVARAGETRSVRLSQDEAGWLARADQRRFVTDSLERFVSAVLSEGVADAGTVRSERSQTLLLIRDSRERLVPRSALITFSDFVERSDRAAVPADDALGQRVFRRIAASFFRPTIVLDAELTASRRGQLRLGVDSLKYRVLAGQQIVASGDAVTAEVREKLAALRDELRRRGPEPKFGRGLVGALLSNVILLVPFWLLLMLYRRETYAQMREMVFLAALLGGVVLVSRGLIVFLPSRPEVMPVALAALLIAMLYNGRLAIVAALTLSMLLGEQWLLRSTPALIFCASSGMAASFAVRAIRRRLRFFTTIGLVFVAFFAASVAVGLTLGWTPVEILASGLTGYAVAVASVAMAVLALPAAEAITGLTTDLTLLELGDPSRPLLRRLALEAPGSWAHSVSMANICEAACSAIGADGLLARIGCYYHDVGKLQRPQFFAENQARGANPHDELDPLESAAIIREHVVHGIELAEAARLPRSVRAFIPEHHGTSEIHYFLHRANQLRPIVGVELEAFRYPGPRPQSRETAVALLADSVEAILRTLPEPTPETVQTAINDIIAQRVASGQLDDAPLTLRDLERVRHEFGRVMAGHFHHRVEYPDARRPTARALHSGREVAARE